MTARLAGATMPRTRVTWTQLAPTYDRLYSDPWSRLEDRRVARLLNHAAGWARRSSGFLRVLDLGCGTGAAFRMLNLMPDLYVGLDSCSSMLKAAKAHRGMSSPAVRLQLVDLGSDEALRWTDGLVRPFNLTVFLYSSCCVDRGLERFTSLAMQASMGCPHALFAVFTSRWSAGAMLQGRLGRRGGPCIMRDGRRVACGSADHHGPCTALKVVRRAGMAGRVSGVSALGGTPADRLAWLWPLDRAACAARLPSYYLALTATAG